MKRIVLAFAVVLALASCAMAEKLQCKTADGIDFSVEVPQGWKGRQIQGGCAVFTQDRSEAISIVYVLANGASAKSFAKDLAKQMQATPEYNTLEDEYVDFDVEVNGQKINITFVGKEGDSTVQVVTTKGESSTLEEIFDSLAF